MNGVINAMKKGFEGLKAACSCMWLWNMADAGLVLVLSPCHGPFIRLGLQTMTVHTLWTLWVGGGLRAIGYMSI